MCDRPVHAIPKLSPMTSLPTRGRNQDRRSLIDESVRDALSINLTSWASPTYATLLAVVTMNAHLIPPLPDLKAIRHPLPAQAQPWSTDDRQMRFFYVIPGLRGSRPGPEHRVGPTGGRSELLTLEPSR